MKPVFIDTFSLSLKQMSQSPTATDDNSTGVFEVFRVGSVPYDGLVSQDFESVKQKYLLIVPINSKEDLKKDSCLAVIPPPSTLVRYRLETHFSGKNSRLSYY